jgi:hypothetical protein
MAKIFVKIVEIVKAVNGKRDESYTLYVKDQPIPCLYLNSDLRPPWRAEAMGRRLLISGPDDFYGFYESTNSLIN